MNAVATTGRKKSIGRRIARHWQLYLVILIPLILLIIFSYIPMVGVLMAFENFRPTRGIFGSQWVGMEHFKTFFATRQFRRLLFNTLGISFYSLAAGFPLPIVLAMSLNQCSSARFKKAAQMITYLPHFISTVVVVSMLMLMFTQKTGIVNNVLEKVIGKRFNFTAAPKYFKSMYVLSGVWQNMGFNSILYLAALSGIDPAQHEAARIDGASRWQRMWHVDFPGVLPTIVITLILNVGSIMSVGYEKILLMQNNLNMSTSDVISTYTYRVGLVQANYGMSTAVGLFNSVINLVLIVSVNALARKFGDTSLW